MTRVWPFVLSLCLAWPLAVWAQTVEVRSGEHANFTRLVFNLPERMDVDLRYQADGVVLSFERDGLTFDTGTVFARVPTTRLAAISVDASRMTLTLACKCDVNTFWAGGQAFVIDIANETEVSAALFPAPENDLEPEAEANAPKSQTAETITPQPQQNNRPLDGVSLNAASVSSTRATQRSMSPRPVGVGSVAFLIADAQERLDQMQHETSDALSAHATNVRQSQSAIVQQIGRAATQGLLSPREDLMPPVLNPEVDSVAVQPSPKNVGSRDTSKANGLGQNVILNAKTSVDQALSDRINLALDGTESTGCLNRSSIDVATWAGDGRFVDQIGNLRSKLLGEFDQPSDADILKMVRFYIHFGFGVEARRVANMLPSERPLSPELSAMIRILDHGHDEPNSIFEGQMDCPPLVAVWSLLSYETPPGNQPIDPDGVVRGILELPTHLRAYLGPVVGQKLRRAGYLRAADHVARALIRNVDTKTASAQYLYTQSSDAAPDTNLGAVVADNAEPAPDALLALIDRRLESGENISEDLAILAGAYAMEYRNTAMGPDLSRAYLLSLASSGNYSESFDEFDRLAEAGPAPTSSTMSEMMALLAQNAPNPAFLTQSIRADQATRFALEDEVGNAVATRLIKLGFPEAAERFVAPMAIGDAERARKLLRAEIALQANLPRKAELELIGEEGKDVMQLIARARSMAGEHGSAQQLFAGMDNGNAALRQAWLEGDWQTLRTHSDPVIAAVATRQATPAAEPDADVTQVLARNNEILEDSQSMRAEIEALLSGIAMPAELDEQAN